MPSLHQLNEVYIPSHRWRLQRLQRTSEGPSGGVALNHSANCFEGIRGLQWKHCDWSRKRLQVRRSKTPAGWRDPSLNQACLVALKELSDLASKLGFADPEHYIFRWHGRDKKIDPTRSMTTWRTAWRSLRKAAGLSNVRFHDGRHTALTSSRKRDNLTG